MPKLFTTPKRTQLMFAAASLGPKFTEWDLTAALFRAAPADWAMRGYPQWPDHKKVMSCLLGNTGPAGKDGLGWIERVAENTYSLTGAGGLKVVELREQLTGGLSVGA